MTVAIPEAEIERLTGGRQTISDKTRALAEAGYTIAQIARALDRSYQQIRQVVKNDEARRARQGGSPAAARTGEGAPGSDENQPSGGVSDAIFRVSVQEDGGVRFPTALLRLAGIAPGEPVTATVRDGEIVLRSATSSMRRAQELVQALLPAGESLAESLLADRRREVKRDAADG